MPTPFFPNRLGATLVAACATAAWAAFGEPWAILGDGAYYLSRAQGAVVEAPFAFRPLAPALAAALAVAGQIPTVTAFFWASWIALVLLIVTYGAIAREGGTERLGRLGLFFGAASFAVAYGATTGVRSDPLLLLAVAGIVRSGRARSGVVLAGLSVVGVLVHEMALFGLLALAFERATGAALFGRASTGPSWRALAVSALVSVVVLATMREMTQALPASMHNWADTPLLNLVDEAIAYAGGRALYAGRIYVAFGPALVFAFAFLASSGRRNQAAAASIFAATVALTFLATDTLRVMALAGIVVFPLAASFVESLWTRRAFALASLALATQALFSAVVFGHLRTFEGSHTLQLAAGALSIVAVGVAGAGFMLVRRDGIRAPRRRRFPSLFKALRGRHTPRAVNVSASTPSSQETWQAPRTTSSSSEPAPAAMRPPSVPINSA